MINIQQYFNLKITAVFTALLFSPVLNAQNVPNPASTAPTGTTTVYQPSNFTTGIKVNYVRTTVPTVPVTTEAAILPTDKTKSEVNTQYLDGLGRPLENISHFASPAGSDLVDIIQYDNLGRESYKFMPYTKAEATVTDNGKFKLNAFTDQKTFYQSTLGYSAENYFYSRKDFDGSPLNLVQRTLPEGNSWIGSDKGKFNLETPMPSGINVRIWTIGYTTGSLPVTSSVYIAGALTIKQSLDEDGHMVESYVNKEGKIVLKNEYKFFGSSPALQTYYVYDDLGILRCVIPPKATAWLAANSWTMTTAIANDLCFRYQYDARLRPVIKYTPGAGATLIVYNLKDQQVLMQNAEQTLAGQWTFTKYDVLGRVIQTGIYNNTSSQVTLQALFNSATYAGSDPLLAYLYADTYGNAAYTTTFTTAKIYVTNYYDDYSFTSRTYNSTSMASLPAGWNNTLSAETTNLLTGTKVLVLDNSPTANELLTVNYYNDRGLLLQSQIQNYKGGWDNVTASYDFMNKKLATLTEINNPSATNNASIKVLETFTYDHKGRILSIMHQLNSNAAVPLVRYAYDELGRIKTKMLGNNADALTYDYNIRGWTTGINKDYCLNNTGTHFFGEELSYDYGYTTNYLSGNIAGMKWRNKGKSTELRSYGYTYDEYGRLTTADFVDKIGAGSYSNAVKDYTASNMAYDQNGNILSMKQMGLNLAGTKIVLDDLQYTYTANTNKLQSVSELTGSQSTNPATYDNLGDFRDVVGTTDYTYDNNGNLKTDANKSFSLSNNIFLDKPEVITRSHSVNVRYIYDAMGNKLQKIATGTTTVTTDYIGNVVYTNNSLEFILHDEGRIRYISTPSAGYSYDYFIKDHLGNTRSVVNETLNTGGDPKRISYIATSEPVLASTENQLFDNVETTRSAKPLSTDPDDTHSAKLNASDATSMIGPDITLKVMAGDSLKISAEALYTPDGSNATQEITQSLINNFATALSGLPSVSAEGGTTSAVSGDNSIADAILQMQNNNPDAGEPRAFLNYILFDENMQLVPDGSGSIKVQDLTTWNTMETGTITIPQNGFIQVFSSNTSNSDVRFDNLIISLYTGQLLEEYNYYPYGLIFDRSAAFSATTKTNYLYNGKELQHDEFGAGNGLEICDYGARMYDSQIGRWNSIDPLADKFAEFTPYGYVLDNPIRLVDNDGRVPGDPNDPAPQKHVAGIGLGFTGSAAGTYGGLGLNAINASNIRAQYSLRVSNLYGLPEVVGKEGRTALLKWARTYTPEPFLSMARDMKADNFVPRPGARFWLTNEEVNIKMMGVGTLGKIFVGVGVYSSGMNIQNAYNRDGLKGAAKQSSIEGGSWAGAYFGFQTGGEAGAVFGPEGAAIGALTFGAVGGIGGRKMVEVFFATPPPTTIEQLKYDVYKGMGTPDHFKAIAEYDRLQKALESLPYLKIR